ncbi:MAG: hypothetical protein ACPGVB_10700, partial [Chitinophagales bacterium]
SVEDEAKAKPTVALHYKSNNASWQILTMESNDVMSNDDVFEASFLPEPNAQSVEYYIEAVDATGLTSRYPKEDSKIVHMRVGPKIFLNEWMPENNDAVANPQGNYESWIEIYNGDEQAVWLGDYFLTNDFKNTQKWNLPSKTLMPDEYMVIWLDGKITEGFSHAPFGFDSNHKQMGIFGPASLNYAPIDSFSYKDVIPNTAYGLTDESQDAYTVLKTSTPGFPNGLSTVSDYAALVNSAKIDTIYPNPFKEIATFAFNIERPLFVKATIFNIKGERIVDLTKRQYYVGTHKIAWSISPTQKESGIRTFVLKLSIKDDKGNEFSPPMERFYWSGD